MRFAQRSRTDAVLDADVFDRPVGVLGASLGPKNSIEGDWGVSFLRTRASCANLLSIANGDPTNGLHS